MIAIIRELDPDAQLSAGPGPYRHGDRVEMIRKGALDVSRAAAELGLDTAVRYPRGVNRVYSGAAQTAGWSLPLRSGGRRGA